MNKKTFTLALVSFILFAGLVDVYNDDKKSTSAFNEPAYLEAKEYVTTELINHPATLTLTGCVDGVAFTIAEMHDMAAQYIQTYPECTKALLSIHKRKNLQLFTR